MNINKMNVHQTVGHPSSGRMATGNRVRSWDGVPDDVTKDAVEAVYWKVLCLACEVAKSKNLPVKVGSGVQVHQIGLVLSIDHLGVYSSSTIYGANRAIYVRYLGCGYQHLFLAATLVDLLKAVINWRKKYRRTNRCIRFEAGITEVALEVKAS